MITKDLIDRINVLARKKRTVGLTEDELAEQQELYRIYLGNIRSQMIDLLESIEFVDDDAVKKNEPPHESRKLLQQTHVYLGQRVLH